MRSNTSSRLLNHSRKGIDFLIYLSGGYVYEHSLFFCAFIIRGDGFRWRKHISGIQLLDFGHYKHYMRYNVVSQHFALFYSALQRTTLHYIIFSIERIYYIIGNSSFVVEWVAEDNTLIFSIVVLVAQIYYKNRSL